MKQINLILILMMVTISAKSQNKIGVEIRTSQNITYNTSNLIGGGSLFSSYEITEEGNPYTTSYSFGVIYKPNLSTSFRLHIGKHQNGRILDLNTHDDIGFTYDYETVDRPYSFVQITPSISFNIIDQKKFKIPAEFGFSINKRINVDDIFFVFIKEYNFDLRLSTGLQYALENFNIGINIVYSKSINEYQQRQESGKYKPSQIGLELAVGYIFEGRKMITTIE